MEYFILGFILGILIIPLFDKFIVPILAKIMGH